MSIYPMRRAATGRYILRGRVPAPCDDMIEWAQAFDYAQRHIARDEIRGARVSTIFLGIDHSHGMGPPVLFETMVFGGPMDHESERTTTYDDAEIMHAEMCARVARAMSRAEQAKLALRNAWAVMRMWWRYRKEGMS